MANEAIEHPEYIAPVIPIDRGSNAEIIDFSEANIEMVTEMLFTYLSHPSTQGLDGIKLGELISDQFTVRETSAPTSINARLGRIDSDEALLDESTYDHKIEHDEVFARLSRLLIKLRNERTTRSQYFAARHLITLRTVTPEDETYLDTRWNNVLDRLYPES